MCFGTCPRLATCSQHGSLPRGERAFLQCPAPCPVARVSPQVSVLSCSGLSAPCPVPGVAARMVVLKSQLRCDLTAQAPLRAPTPRRMKEPVASAPKCPCPASWLALQILRACAPSSPLPRIPPPHTASGQISVCRPLTMKLSLTLSFPCTRPPSPGQQTTTHGLTLVHIIKLCWNPASLIHRSITCDYFRAMAAELPSSTDTSRPPSPGLGPPGRPLPGSAARRGPLRAPHPPHGLSLLGLAVPLVSTPQGRLWEVVKVPE